MINSQNPARRSRVVLSALLLACAGTVTTSVRAQEDPSAAETAAARALAVDGLKLAKAGQCREAVEKLERAEKLRHSPIVLARLGECYVSIGKLVQGTEALRKFLREPLPPDANATLKEAYERAQVVIQETKGNIAGLTIAISGADRSKVTLTVDGVEVPSTLIGVEMPVDPGEHVIEASGAAYLKSSARAKLAPGEKQSISIELKPDPEAAKQKAEEPARTGVASTLPEPNETRAPNQQVDMTTATPPASSGSSKALAYVSYGVGALGIGAGILFGRSAMQDKDQLEAQCPGKVCPPDQEDRLNSARTKGVVSTIGFGVGAAGVVLGTVLLVTSSGSSSSSSAQANKSPTALRLRPRAAVGLGSIQLGADF
ncbi:MAG: hypothetical protein ACOY0T_15630 [Myxococcota bacterium]